MAYQREVSQGLPNPSRGLSMLYTVGGALTPRGSLINYKIGPGIDNIYLLVECIINHGPVFLSILEEISEQLDSGRAHRGNSCCVGFLRVFKFPPIAKQTVQCYW